ncbi:carbonic anhydrase/acetyltransferase-like protein (isoleucine patch superfamily) [Scopulibacillus daqui]|uniref:Carbonic anhydrase/acetyltransferase-like protein (Isoleucine patch superfamily) n=1 Tax=Scopulibacillus daqui TaxID=1469162 RepID=A0ABS2PUX0_9BACL|nr:gamma carbonic anhydrase family protein [Scopulibacillus daqui]MBM7643854.1 carbonic anhydrase/acetyltransferase-like protein (isoleucine patch superfamily) [Scopulibacillus daqui]
MLIRFQSHFPNVHESVYIADGAKIIGDVTIGKETSIWFNAVIRGDEAPITIGERCSIQDNATLHLYEDKPLVIEDDVTVGHNVILHGCTVRKGALVGMGATVLDGADIGEEAFIAAHALVPPGKKIPPRTMVMGSPCKIVRELTNEELQNMKKGVQIYVNKGKIFKASQD